MIRYTASNQNFANLMAFGIKKGDSICTESDLAALLDHQLRSPLIVDLADSRDLLTTELARWTKDTGQSISNFRDLLLHLHPPVKLLELMKQYFKAFLDGKSTKSIPYEVAGVLYYAVIVAALLRCQRRITSLSDRELAEGIDLVLGMTFLDPEIRSLLLQGSAFLQQSAA